MAENIVDYVERMLAPLDASSFTPVDSLVLSWASYFRVLPDVPEAGRESGVRIGRLLRAECFETFFSTIWEPAQSRRLLLAMGASPRFRRIVESFAVDDTDEDAQKQFAACCFVLASDLVYIAFRGTDRTLVGWKEDFNMTFCSPVPAQEAAADYLAAVAQRTDAKLLVGGHSKGGNLAVYAAARNADFLGDRLVRVYSHDGPGFLPEILDSPGFRRIADRVSRTVPQSSVVGMFLEHSGGYEVVKSTRLGLSQHDPFTWVVEGSGFVTLEDVDFQARRIDAVLKRWLSEHDASRREILVDAIYSLVTVPGAETVTDLVASWQTNLPEVRDRIAALDPEVRSLIIDMLKSLAAESVRRAPRALVRRSRSTRAIRRTPEDTGE